MTAISCGVHAARLCLALLLVACATAPPIVQTAIGATGSEPRRVLRYKFVKGDSHRMQIEVGDEGAITTSVIDTVVEDVTPDGNAKVRITVVDSQAPEGRRWQQENAGDSIGVVRTATLSPSGAESDEHVMRPDHDPVETSRTLEGVGFPEEPLGVGATWDETGSRYFGGMTLKQVEHHTITAIDGDAVSIHSVIEGQADLVQPGHVGHANLVGTSDVVVHLDAPLASTGHVAYDIVVKMDAREQTLHVETATNAL